MRQFKSLLILCLLFIFSGLQMELKASHAMGADLSYECLGSNQFRITLKFYRDCNGVDAPNFINLTENGPCPQNVSVSLSLESGYPQIVTPICASEPDACSGNGTYGIEEFVYSGTVTLPPAGSCPVATFGYSLCCRNGAITTLNQASSQSMYIETEIDRQNVSCNSSPEFTNRPTPYTCVGEPISFNHGAVDPENDELRFSLVNCQQSNGGGVNYGGSFNGTTPLTTASGVSIDQNTGTITFTPTATQVGIICIRVEEYRNNVKIGETIRDMQFTVINCPNSLPIASGIDGNANSSGATGDYSVAICEGEYICFDIATYDGNGDIMNMSWNGGISSGQFTVSGQNTTSPSGTFCWGTSEGDVGSNFFTVTLVDEACPLEGSNTFSYEVNVFANPNPPVNVQADATICPGESVNLTSNASSGGGNMLFWAPATNITSTNTQNTTVSPSQSAIYSLTVEYPDGCTDTDFAEITVLPNPEISLNSTYIVTCPGQTVTLIAAANLIPSDFNVVGWVENPGGAASSLGTGTIVGSTTSLNVTPSVVTEYEITIENDLGCQAVTSVLVDVSSPPPLNACNLIYVDNVNSVTEGTPTNPTGLLDALDRSLCNNTVIKLATGTYNLDNAISIPSYVTLEGGFDPADNWKKTSLKGATTINRTTANIEDQAGASPRLVAMYGDFATGFRLQDLTITTDDAPEVADYAYNAISTYGIHMDNCEDYEIIRTCIQVGNAERGEMGDQGNNGTIGENGDNGSNGDSDNENGEGAGGAGGDGGSILCTASPPLFNGSGGGACSTGGCCFGGCAGVGGNTVQFYSCGSGGGGGGGGGQENRDGGEGGVGGAVTGGGVFPFVPQNNAYATTGPCRNSGQGAGNANGCTSGVNQTSGQSGRCGADGANGLPGNAGGAGVAGIHGALFFEPGAAGTLGSYGRGGQGGKGGAGGAGEGESGVQICNDGGGAGGGGGGGGGEGGGPGAGGRGGGSSYGLYLVNSATGTISQADISAGAAGAGGTGGTGGAGGAGGTGGTGGTGGGDVGNGGHGGDGGDGGIGGQGGVGIAGESIDIYGSSPTYAAFDLINQPIIMAQDLSCTYSDITFCGPNSGSWNFGANSTPTTANGLNVITQFTDIDRHDITFGGDLYEGFFYVGFDGQTPPEISASANQVTGTVDSFYLCEGDIATFFTTQIADSFHWDFNGAISNPPTTDDFVNGTFNTSGEYWVELYITTLCCGDSPIDSVYLFVDPIMDYTVDVENHSICDGEIIPLTLNPAFANVSIDSVSWNPTTNLNVVDVLTANVAPTSTIIGPATSITYTATLYSATHSGEYVCADQVDFIVGVDEIPEVAAIFDNPVFCDEDGTDVFVLLGGTGNAGHTFDWSHDPAATGDTQTGLPSGLYTITLTNSGGCSATHEFTLELGLFAPTVYFTDIENINCANDMDGTVTAELYNSGPNVDYLWSNSSSNTVISNLAPGVYTITATDNDNNCTVIEEIEIFSPEPLMVTGSPDDVSCGTDGGVSLDFPTGGIPQYLYNWSNSSNDMILTGVGVGTYTVTVTDENGCTTTEEYLIGLDSSPDVEFIRN